MKLIPVSRYALSFTRSISTKTKDPEIKLANKALEEIDVLIAKGEFNLANEKLEEANKKFPSLYKAYPLYRCEILGVLYKQYKNETPQKADGNSFQKTPELR